MKNIKKSIALFSFAAVLFMTSCKEIQMQPVSVTGMNEVKVSGISLKGFKGNVNVKIKNPNATDVTLYRSKLNVTLNGIPVGNAQTKGRIVIPANSEVEEVMYLKSDFSQVGIFDIPKVVSTVKNKNFDLAIKGNLKGGQYWHKKLMHVDATENINVKEKIKAVSDSISGVMSKFKKKSQ